jgi:3-methyladenine DNA glycosylase AlkD
MEYCITNRSWWDTVDFIATECLGPYFKMYPKHILRITKQWNQSTNMWLQRSSLLFQKNYKKDTDTKLLSEYILNLTSSKEFFIQKAIGWMLREYGKTDAAWVVNFVNKNELAPLSKREAIKHLLK